MNVSEIEKTDFPISDNGCVCSTFLFPEIRTQSSYDILFYSFFAELQYVERQNVEILIVNNKM
jgi:hypothetical protein